MRPDLTVICLDPGWVKTGASRSVHAPACAVRVLRPLRSDGRRGRRARAARERRRHPQGAREPEEQRLGQVLPVRWGRDSVVDASWAGREEGSASRVVRTAGRRLSCTLDSPMKRNARRCGVRERRASVIEFSLRYAIIVRSSSRAMPATTTASAYTIVSPRDPRPTSSNTLLSLTYWRLVRVQAARQACVRRHRVHRCSAVSFRWTRS